MDILLLHNRTAGNETLSAGRLLALLRREGYNPKYFDLHAALETPGQLPDAEFVVVAGGDGSFRKVALQLPGLRRPLALLPLGTANNIARSLGIVGSMPEIIAGWDQSRRVRFDVGRARGPWGEQRFVEGVGIGLFARIISILGRVETSVAHASAERTHRVASDLRSTTVLAHEMTPVDGEVTLDGEKIPGGFLMLEILNIARVGAGVELAAAADSSDGWLDVAIATAAEREKLLETLGNAARGVTSPSSLPIRRCRVAELNLPRGELRIDDRVIPLEEPARIEITLDAGALEVLVPGGE